MNTTLVAVATIILVILVVYFALNLGIFKQQEVVSEEQIEKEIDKTLESELEETLSNISESDLEEALLS
ncbi:MAG: hypothetical protein J7L39_02925 [Candidatus Aenigmarchaeota archaeon]|nr:hypothetical protein [Candidatus Aenigmarchaeota archaeon]